MSESVDVSVQGQGVNGGDEGAVWKSQNARWELLRANHLANILAKTRKMAASTVTGPGQTSVKFRHWNIRTEPVNYCDCGRAT